MVARILLQLLALSALVLSTLAEMPVRCNAYGGKCMKASKCTGTSTIIDADDCKKSVCCKAGYSAP